MGEVGWGVRGMCVWVCGWGKSRVGFRGRLRRRGRTPGGVGGMWADVSTWEGCSWGVLGNDVWGGGCGGGGVFWG